MGGMSTRGRRADGAWRHLAGLAATVFSLMPVVFVVSAAFSPAGTLSSRTLVPDRVTLANVRSLVADPVFAAWCANSLAISGTAAAASVLVSTLAAYALSRMRFAGRSVTLYAVILIQTFPQFLSIAAIYLVMIKLGRFWPVLGLGSPVGLVVVYVGGALSAVTVLMKGFFDALPKELDEAAAMDGATNGQIFVRVVLPLAVPALVVCFVLVFISTINEVMLASVFLNDRYRQTLAPGLVSLVQDNSSDFGRFCVGTLITAVPTVAMLQVGRRFLTRGLVGGAEPRPAGERHHDVGEMPR
jgi:arabinogalactan oligomer / maltooligosaccharide transport system permease protein